MSTLNAPLLKSFPIFRECFPMRFLNPIYYLPYFGNLRRWEILLKEKKFMPFRVPMEPRRMEKSHDFVAPLKKNKKAFNLTCSSSTPCSFILTQIMWNSLRWVWRSSLASPLNIGKCINPNLSLKLTLLSMFMHNGWFSMLGATSSLSIYCHVTTMVLMWPSFHNLCKVFFIWRSTCTFAWLVDQVTGINS